MDQHIPKSGKPGRGKDTLFRVAYQHQGHLVQVADYKANMIISICTMIISAIIAVIGYGVVTGKGHAYVPMLVVPVLLIVISSLFSLIFAIIAARPKFMFNPGQAENQNSSLLFFGRIAGYKRQEYLDLMKRLLDDDVQIYEQMTIDLYNQGLILKRKYGYLKYAYAVLLIGFIGSVVSFLIFFLAYSY